MSLAQQVRELRPLTQIAFLSGYDDFAYAQKAIESVSYTHLDPRDRFRTVPLHRQL